MFFLGGRWLVELKLSVCHSISWNAVELSWFSCLIVRLSCCPAVPLNQCLQDLPHYGNCVPGKPYVQHLSGFCWSKREGNNQRGRLIATAVPKTAQIPTPLYYPWPSQSRSEISWKVGEHDLWRSLSSSVDMSELQLGIMRGCSLLRRAGRDVSLTPTPSHLGTRFCLILCVCSPHELLKSIFNKHSCLEVAI